ncbi:MAG: uracil-DNA glycosylase family protein [Gammaproteobacteria bacterium]|nr:uracil-DNA glycosylase family protein [Gammaproteobacteria bacterium]
MLTPRQQHCLAGIGIRLWQQRSAPADAPVDALPATAADETEAVAPASLPPLAQPAARLEPAAPARSFNLDDWDQTLSAIEACHNCTLGDSCSHKVPGKGQQQAELMIIGEAPGRDEDLQGLPFVGRAGQLLDKMLQAIQLDPQQVYITNILKCRPPNNRDPQPDEIQSCTAFLQAQIRLVQPKVILSVGRISAQNLLHDARPLGQLRSSQHRLPDSDIPLLVTYHPAYLLRNPAEKAKVWEDLKALHRLLNDADR